MKRSPLRPSFTRKAFSLIELMVSIAVLSMLLVIVFQMLEQMQRTWKKTRQTVSEFKDARNGFEEMGRRLGQATLNAYYGYNYGVDTVGGQSFRFGRQIVRQSELHFVSGPSAILLRANRNQGTGSRPGHSVFFQAPFGFCYDRSRRNRNRLEFEQLNSLLNAWGYFVEFNTDELDRPRFLNTLVNAPAPRPRYRLMEFRQPTEYLQIYKLNLRDRKTLNQETAYEWFTKDIFGVNSPWNTEKEPRRDELFFRTTRPIAENIIAMVILPREAETNAAGSRPQDLAPEYLYDSRRWQWSSSTALPVTKSRHVLPPILDVTFIAVDETSFATFAQRQNIVDITGDPELIPPDLFVRALNREVDLEEVETKLRALRIDFRIFTSSIRLRESRWEDT